MFLSPFPLLLTKSRLQHETDISLSQDYYTTKLRMFNRKGGPQKKQKRPEGRSCFLFYHIFHHFICESPCHALFDMALRINDHRRRIGSDAV